MLRFNPTKRATVDEALDHPFLKSVRRAGQEKSPGEGLKEMDDSEEGNSIPSLRKKIFMEAEIYRRRDAEAEKGEGGGS